MTWRNRYHQVTRGTVAVPRPAAPGSREVSSHLFRQGPDAVYCPRPGTPVAPRRGAGAGTAARVTRGLTDEQWTVLEPRARQVMADLRSRWAGRWSMTCGRCATRWLRVKTASSGGLPVDSRRGRRRTRSSSGGTARLPLALVTGCGTAARRQGRAAQPSACIVDHRSSRRTTPSQAPTTTTQARRSPQSQHLASSRAGCSPWSSPRVRRRQGRASSCSSRSTLFSTLQVMSADSGYNGSPAGPVRQAAAAITVEVVRRTSPALLPGPPPPLGHRAHLRLADALPQARRDYERRPTTTKP